jgi:FkbM family methyltransferase
MLLTKPQITNLRATCMTAESNIDRDIYETFFRAQSKPGTLVEVGAARPDYLSISASFRQMGWKIVAVEPNPAFCALHRALGYDVLQYACSDTESDSAEFFVVNSFGVPYYDGNVSFESFSSLGINGQYQELYNSVQAVRTQETINVKVRRLDTILQEHEPDIQAIDIVAVDVEGWELNVMRGFSLEKYRPRVVILENLFLKDEYVDYMRERGYILWKRLEPNDIYINWPTAG